MLQRLDSFLSTRLTTDFAEREKVHTLTDAKM
jgi:hypothetical protein